MNKLFVLIKTYHPEVTASGNLIKNLIPFFEEKYQTTVLTTTSKKNLHSSSTIIRFEKREESSLESKLRNKLKLNNTVINREMYSYLLTEINNSKDKKIILLPITLDEIALAIKLKKQFPKKILLSPFLLEELLVTYSKKVRSSLKIDLEIYSDILYVLPKLRSYFNCKEKVVILEHPMVRNEINLESPHTPSIVYAGGLNKRSRNPRSILDWFYQNSQIEMTLDFYSYGNCEQMIINYENKDNRIKANGPVSSNEVMKVMSNASFLITIGNRNPNLVPSKIFDCISTGNPIIHFYYSLEDPYINYLENYRYSICLDINQIDTVRLNSFIQNNLGNILPFEEIKEEYEFALPQTIFNQLSVRMEEILLG